MQHAARSVFLGLLAGLGGLAHAEGTDAHAPVSAIKLSRMPESLEVRYALSAAPQHLRADATVYLLDPSRGYVLNHKGANGISCIVVRSDWQWADRAFRDDIYWPVCYDAEGSRTLLQDYLYTARLRAQGMDSKRVHSEVTERFAKPEYPNPGRAGVSYMIGPIMRTFPGDPDATEPVTMNMPHYMFYAPNVTDAQIGGKPYSAYPFILSMYPGRDDYIILLMGNAEKAQILAESKALLGELCVYRAYLCTTGGTRSQMPGGVH